MIFRIVSTRARHQNNRGIDLGPESPPVINRKEPAMTIRASVFNAYGTLYDVQSVRRLATELCGEKGEFITQLWRLKQLEYS